MGCRVTKLPPPLLIEAEAADTNPQIAVEGTADPELALAFGDALLKSRRARGFDDPLILSSSDERPGRLDGQAWAPHVFCFEALSRLALVWERLPLDELDKKLGAYPAELERWATRPQLLLRLLSIASSTDKFVRPSDAQAHLSFRWIMANQEEAAAIVSRGVVEIEHVSIHVKPSEEESAVELLTLALGLIEIPRPADITVPGRWLQAGCSRIHLNSRDGRADEADFPGPRPNHVCLAVSDLDGAEHSLKATGVSTLRAGSLGEQIWFRLGGTSIELQPFLRR
jgi:hypothetical protein